MQDKRYIIKRSKFYDLLTIYLETGGLAQILPIANKQFPSRLWVEIDYRNHTLIIKPKKQVIEMMGRTGNLDSLLVEELKLKEHFHDLLCHGHIKTLFNEKLKFSCVIKDSIMSYNCHELELFISPELDKRLKMAKKILNLHEKLLKKLLS